MLISSHKTSLLNPLLPIKFILVNNIDDEHVYLIFHDRQEMVTFLLLEAIMLERTWH